MSTKEAEGDSSDAECPTCGKELASRRGMKIHHKRTHGDSIAGIELTCVVCNEDFRASPHQDDRRKCCSVECQNEWQRISGVNTGENSPNWEGGEVTVECDQCGQPYDVKRCEADDSRFCSRSCQGDWTSENRAGEDHHMWSGREVLICEYCDEEYERIPSQSDSRFCSQSCMGDWMSENMLGEQNRAWKPARPDLNCDQCGESFDKPPSKADRRFCCEGCMSDWMAENWTGEDNHAWKGGHTPINYGTGFTEEKKERVRVQQDRLCAVCGCPESIEGRRLSVHHIISARLFDDDKKRNALSNLVGMCHSCHRTWEGIPLRPQTPQKSD